MNQHLGVSDSLVISYLGLRKAVGIIGIALPFVLALGKIVLEEPGILSSISSYYYTVMRDVFVGSLCAIAVFLMSYRGYERKDDIAGDLACIFALGAALFPIAPDVGATLGDKVVGALHLLFAACLFLTLAFFSLVLFRKTDSTKTPTRKKLQRNIVYTVCGYTILACIALIVVVGLISDDSPIKRLDPVFWLESAAVVAFGVSWLTKGEAILKDEAA
ncbi:MAG: DUF998 domain-containing protein [Planctomycetota bacterium]